MTVLRAVCHTWLVLKHLQFESIGYRFENFFHNKANLSETPSYFPQCSSGLS